MRSAAVIHRSAERLAVRGAFDRRRNGRAVAAESGVLHAFLHHGMIRCMPRTSLSGWRAASAVGIGMAWLAVVLASADRPEAAGARPVPPQALPLANAAQVADWLPGMWLREQVDHGVQSRRLLHLEPGGTFREQVRLVGPGGVASRHEHAGTWFYDGMNLKRKYSLMNGRPPSRLNLPFATFQIRFESRHEFVGTDHIHRNVVRYRRVAAETEL